MKFIEVYNITTVKNGPEMKVFMYTIITTMLIISYFETSPVAANEACFSIIVVKFSIILYVLKCIILVFTIDVDPYLY